MDQNNQTLSLDTRAAIRTEKNLINLMTLDSNGSSAKLLENSNPVLKNGQVDLYLVPNGTAGQETLSISIPGLKEEKIKIRIHPGPLAKIKIKMDKTLVPI